MAELVYRNGQYHFHSSYAEKDIAKDAKFRWSPEHKIWWTDDERRAAQLVRYATGEARERLHSYVNRAAEQMKASRATDADVDLPRPEGLDYLPYQRAGILYATQRDHTLIADEMGLGKTIQGIGVANVTGARKILVICPASLRINWQREILKWSVDGASVVIATGTKLNDDLVDRLQSFFALDDHVGFNSAKEVEHVLKSRNSPEPLFFDRLDRPASQALVASLTDDSSVRGKELDKASISGREGYHVGSLRSICGDPPLSVNNSGHVREYTNVIRQADACGGFALSPVSKAGKPLVVIPQSFLFNANLAGECRHWVGTAEELFRLKQLEELKQLMIGVTGASHRKQYLVVNYDLVEHWRKVIDLVPWCTLIADESHYLKNEKARRTAAVLGGEIKVAAKRAATARTKPTGSGVTRSQSGTRNSAAMRNGAATRKPRAHS